MSCIHTCVTFVFILGLHFSRFVKSVCYGCTHIICLQIEIQKSRFEPSSEERFCSGGGVRFIRLWIVGFDYLVMHER